MKKITLLFLLVTLVLLVSNKEAVGGAPGAPTNGRVVNKEAKTLCETLESLVILAHDRVRATEKTFEAAASVEPYDSDADVACEEALTIYLDTVDRFNALHDTYYDECYSSYDKNSSYYLQSIVDYEIPIQCPGGGDSEEFTTTFTPS